MHMRERERERDLFSMILLLKCMVLLSLQINVSISKKFLGSVPKIFLSSLASFSVVLAYLEFRVLFLKIKKGK